MSLITDFDAHAVFDSFWDIDIFLDSLMELSFSVTVLTLFDYLLACSVTCMTWTLLFHHTEYRLHTFAYLTTSMTGCTCLGSSTSTITVMTVNFSIERYLAARAADCILERYLHGYLDISSDVRSLAPATSTTESSTEEL